MRGYINGKKAFGLTSTIRWIPEKSDHGKLSLAMNYQVTEFFTLGFDYRPVTRDIEPIVTCRLWVEQGMRPAFTVGLSSDTFDGVDSQAVHAVFSKKVYENGGLKVSPYAGAIYIFENSSTEFVGGVHVSYGRCSLLGMWTGTDVHVVMNYDLSDRFALGFVWWGMDMPGMVATVRY